MTNLRAFHGKRTLKTTYLKRVRAHAAADEIEHGIYWQGGRGCAVGCTVHSDAHDRYETELGLPTALAKLEDDIFEGLAPAQAKHFPEQFLQAVRVGADTERVTLTVYYRTYQALLAGDLDASTFDLSDVDALYATDPIPEGVKDLIEEYLAGAPLNRPAFDAAYPRTASGSWGELLTSVVVFEQNNVPARLMTAMRSRVNWRLAEFMRDVLLRELRRAPVVTVQA